MVIERPPVSDSPVELEAFEEATPAESTPVDALPIGVMLVEGARREGRYHDAPPAEEELEEAMPDASVAPIY